MKSKKTLSYRPRWHTPHATEIPFDEFFETGQEEHLSPFLTSPSRKWAAHLPLKIALLATILLFLAYMVFWTSFSAPLAMLLLIFVYFLAGIPSLIDSIEDLAAWQINIDVLMTLAAFGSVLIGSPFEGGLLLVLFALSGAMEDSVTRKAKASISSLHKLTPTRAFVVDEEGISMEKALSEIVVHTKILVKAGQVVPLDGKVLEGISSVNLVHLTGENLPVTKKPGDQVPAGALNLEGALLLSVTHTSADSTLARIIQLVTQAQEAKPTLQRWFDRLSKTYATSIIVIAALFALTLPWLAGLDFLGQGGSLYRALAFLIAASPCALIIAIPIAYLSAISACARKGIILKGGISLDALATCRAIAFDKTGTLTTGKLHCLGFESFSKDSKISLEEALEIGFAMEQNAVHPIAQAITQYALAKNSKPAQLTSFKSIPGYGLEASIEETQAFLGNMDFIEQKIDTSSFKAQIESLRSAGEILTLLLIGKELFIFRFQDSIRPEVHQTLDQLRKGGYELLMLTGDHRDEALRVANVLGITEVYADLKPEDKLRLIAEKSATRGLAMVGDGVNDAPALARATVGISMGKVGSSAAIEAADIVLLQDNIERLDWLMQKAHATQWIVRENLILATLAIFIASIPAVAGLVPLWLAVVLHEGGTVLVGLNGLRLLKTGVT